MSDQEILDRAERAAKSVVLPDGRFEDLLRRRDRKRRNERITAAAVGIAVFLAAVWIALALLRAGLFLALVAVFLAVFFAAVVVGEAVLPAWVRVVFAFAVVVFAEDTVARVDC